jgi:hypothetical protein
MREVSHGIVVSEVEQALILSFVLESLCGEPLPRKGEDNQWLLRQKKWQSNQTFFQRMVITKL